MDLNYYDVRELKIRGRGWDNQDAPYARLPNHAHDIVTEPVWRLSRQSTGLWVDFISNAGTIHARTELNASPAEGQEFIKYLDLYCRDADGQWRWAGVSKYGVIPSGETPLVEGVPETDREWRLYLPLTYDVSKLELGIPAGCRLAPAPDDRRPPVVVYGTSIVHGGAHVSRPGMVWPSVVGRRLDWPVINLGFSGSARSEPALAHILSELNAAIFVIDPLANMSLELVEQNMAPFMRILVEKHPRTPMLMIEDRTHANAWLRPDYATRQKAKQRAYNAVADKLRQEGYALSYLPGNNLIGHDSEATTDGSHPSDLGAVRYADAVTALLADLLCSVHHH